MSRLRSGSRSGSSGCISNRTPANRCTISRRQNSFVDLNRSGIALMEIVSKPDLRSADEAKAYLTKLRTILRYLGTCDGNMEQGSLRADVNVSVRRPGEPLGTRCEIKNVNSIRFIGQAIEAEARRQIGIIEDGGKIDQETRLFDPGRGETRSMRSKEEAHDYRYFPDPDLLPLEFDQDFVDALRAICRSSPMRRRLVSSAITVCRPMTRASSSPTRTPRTIMKPRSSTGAESAMPSSSPIGSPAMSRPTPIRSACPSRKPTSSPAQIAEIVDLISDGTIRARSPRMCWRSSSPRTRMASARHRRGPWHDASHRSWRDRGLRRCDRRRESGQGRAGTGQAFDARLVCRSGHERHGRQGQSPNRQRALKGETRGLKSDRESPIDFG